MIKCTSENVITCFANVSRINGPERGERDLSARRDSGGIIRGRFQLPGPVEARSARARYWQRERRVARYLKAPLPPGKYYIRA